MSPRSIPTPRSLLSPLSKLAATDVEDTVRVDSNECTYWRQLSRTTPPRLCLNEGCFGGMCVGWQDRGSVWYLAPLHEGLSRPAANWWVRSLRSWLPGPWTATWVTIPGSDGRRGLLFHLPIRRGTTYSKALLYLTAFRYIHRDADYLIVARLYSRRAQHRGVASRFRALQRTHLPLLRDNDVIETEVLYCPPSIYYGRSAEDPISLARFRRRLKDKRVTSVQAHFA